MRLLILFALATLLLSCTDQMDGKKTAEQYPIWRKSSWLGQMRWEICAFKAKNRAKY